MTPEEARRVAAEKKASFFDTVDAVQKKVGVEAGRVESAIAESQELKTKVDGYVRGHPWVFVLGALALGVALGSRPQRRRRASEPSHDRGGIVSVVADGLAAQLGRIFERMLMTAFEELKKKWLDRPAQGPDASGPPAKDSPSESASRS